jgi:hypothetical protein
MRAARLRKIAPSPRAHPAPLRARLEAAVRSSPSASASTQVPRSASRPPAGCRGRRISEALSNLRRHAHARHVRIALAVTEDVLACSVCDDGVGFQPRSMVRREFVTIPGCLSVMSPMTGARGAWSSTARRSTSCARARASFGWTSTSRIGRPSAVPACGASHPPLPWDAPRRAWLRGAARRLAGRLRSARRSRRSTRRPARPRRSRRLRA